MAAVSRTCRGLIASLPALAMFVALLPTQGARVTEQSDDEPAQPAGARPKPLDCTGDQGVRDDDVRRAQQDWARYLGRKIEEEVEVAGGVTMTFVLIPPGKFRMGSPATEKMRDPDEASHEVEFAEPFDLGKFEVTQEQYEALTGINPSHFVTVPGQDTKKFPVEMVTRDDADAYAERLTRSRKDKYTYRLPTEAEWEYACRGGRPSSVPFGVGRDGRSLSSLQANFMGERPYGRTNNGPNLRRTCHVGSYPANALGLHDMHGNVWEWCADAYGPYPGGKAKQFPGTAKGSLQVIRGGSWNAIGVHCRAAYRGCDNPGTVIPDSDLGFRLARSVGVPSKSRY